MSRKTRMPLDAAIIGVALIGAAPAFAQSTPAVANDSSAAAQDPGALEREVIVTGSRISKAGFEAPTPTTVIDAGDIAASPQPNIAANLNQLPVLSGSTSPRTAGNGVGGGAQGANFLNLRNLGANRTLVLLDHRRVVGAATTGSVDLSLLPTSLLKRVDVVTGGASAAWGSDAVAGVVNLVLDNKFAGLKGTAQAGISTYGDAAEFRAELAGGASFAGGRGHVIASASYTRSDSIDRVDSRPWFVGSKVTNNPAYVAGNGQPKLIVSSNVNSPTGTYGGLITSGPLAGTQFLAGGIPAAFNFGTVGSNVAVSNTTFQGSQTSIGGTPNDLAAANQIIARGRQFSAFFRGSYELSDSINLYGEFIFGRSVADSLSVPYLTMSPNGAALTILRSNPYLPAATAAAMDTAKVTSIPLARANMDLGEAAPHNERELYRYLIGADIHLGGTWSAQVYYERGLSRVLNEARNDVIRSNFAQATDAARDAGGNIVCRSTLTNPTNGCVPFNVFGPQNPSAAQIAYLIGTARQHISLQENVAALSLNGDLFHLPAGSVTLAAGAEYRSESHVADADAISQQNTTGTAPGSGNWWVGNYKPSSGGFNVKEAFGEILVPIFKDSPIGRSLDFNGAVRVTDYSTSGSVVTWKAGLSYDIGGGLKLRGVLSRDIRAPNLGEYYLGGTSTTQTVVDGANGNASVLRIQSGNPNLRPEIARTLTAGVVFQPVFLRGFNLSVDYFHIRIGDAIATLANQQIVDRCAAGNTALCAFIVRDAAGKITQLNVQPVNFKTELMSGVDLEGSYRFAVGQGHITLRSLWTYTGRHDLIDSGTVDPLLGEVGQGNGPVKWRGLNSIAYDSDRLSVSLRHRYIGPGVLDAQWTAADIADNRVKAVSYFDLSTTVKVKLGSKSFEMFASVDNLLNAAPPVAPSVAGTFNTTIGTGAAFYDLVGRYFRAGIRFRI